MKNVAVASFRDKLEAYKEATGIVGNVGVN